MGIRCGVSRNPVANAKLIRDWRSYIDFAQALIQMTRRLYVDEDLGVELDNAVYALDASTTDSCLSVFPWAWFQQTKGSVKLHTLLDLRQCSHLPQYLRRKTLRRQRLGLIDPVTQRFIHHGSRLPELHPPVPPASGARHVPDPRQILHEVRRIYSRQAGKTIGLHGAPNRCSHRRAYPPLLPREVAAHRVLRCHARQDLRLLGQPRLIACTDYRRVVPLPVAGGILVQMDQHLRIKAIFHTSENAVASQIWLAVSVQILAAIIKQWLNILVSIYKIL